MNYYAVIDTNVIVSALLKSNSIPGCILSFSFDNVITPILNKDIIKEYREVLSRPKFHLSKDIIDDVISQLELNGIYVDEINVDEFLPDPKDVVFYAVTLNSRKSVDTYLVTGNIKHFPNKMFIVTPREMFDIIVNKN